MTEKTVTQCCRPDEHYSYANNDCRKQRTVQGENVPARLREREACTAFRAGAPGATPWGMGAPDDYQIRQRYRENFVDAGMATHDRSEDGIY